MLVELRRALEAGTALTGCCAPIVGTLYDALALILSEIAQERNEATSNQSDQVEVGLVENLDEGAPSVNAFDDVEGIAIQSPPVQADGYWALRISQKELRDTIATG